MQQFAFAPRERDSGAAARGPANQSDSFQGRGARCGGQTEHLISDVLSAGSPFGLNRISFLDLSFT